MVNEFTHIDKNNTIKMVDISDKENSIRIAEAYGIINLDKKTINLLTDGKIKKGNVLTTAKIAAIQGAKETYRTIPLCHQILTEAIDIDFKVNEDCIEIYSTVKSTGKTGAEMEALNSVSCAALTIYDMCKAVDKSMIIKEIKLCRKSKKSV